MSCQSWALWQWGSHTEAARASDGIWPCSCLGTFTVRASRGTRKVGSPHLFLLFPAALQKGFDVFNALDLMENKTFLEKLKFGIGDGNLQYYLYNWKCPSMGAEKVCATCGQGLPVVTWCVSCGTMSSLSGTDQYISVALSSWCGDSRGDRLQCLWLLFPQLSRFPWLGKGRPWVEPGVSQKLRQPCSSRCDPSSPRRACSPAWSSQH